MMFLKNKKRTIKFDLITKTILIILVTVISIVSYTFIKSRAAAIKTATDMINKLNVSSVSQAADDLAQARVISRNSASLLFSQTEVIGPDSTMVRYLASTLLTTNYIASLWYASPHVFFKMFDVKGKDADPFGALGKTPIPDEAHYGLRVVLTQDNGEKSDRFYLFNRQFQMIKELKSEIEISYDKELGWYEEAKKTLKNFWSPLHLVHRESDAGITNVTPVLTESGEFNGVFGVDFAAEGLSVLLNEMLVDDNSRSYIIDGENHIVANSEMRENTERAGENSVLLDINTYKNEDLVKAIQAYNANPKHPFDESKRLFRFSNKNGVEYVVSVTPLPQSLDLNWKVISLTPLDTFTKAIISIQENNIYISIFILFVACLFIYFQTLQISYPLGEMMAEVAKLRHMNFEENVFPKSDIVELHELSNSMKEVKTTFTNFSKYIPKALVTKLNDAGKEVVLGGESHELTILFSDVAGFTTVSESLTPMQLMLHLSDYFENLTEIILSNNGTIDKFIGDAIMAFWGAPDKDDRRSYNACKAALLCLQKLKVLNKYWEGTRKPALNTRFGLNAGPAVVGNVGSTERMNYTALGDAVNLAARLEGTNKMYGTNIIISESVKLETKDLFITRPLDVVAVKGKNKGVKIFELVGAAQQDGTLKSTPEAYRHFCAQFETAFDLYLKQEWKASLGAFATLAEENERTLHYPDSVIPTYIKRCETFMKEPPASDWDGVMHLKEK